MDYNHIKREVATLLKNATGLQVFDTYVGPGAQPPFIRFYSLASDLSPEFQTGPSFRRHVLVVDVVSSSEVATEAESKLDTIITTLNGHSFAGGAKTYRMQVINTRKVHDPDSRQWMVGAEISVHAYR